MFIKMRSLGLLSAVALLGVAISIPVAAQSGQLRMLDTLTKGGWELKIRGSDASRRICVRSGHELIQLQHRQQGCSQFVVKDTADEITVQYTCRGHGYGRTSIRRETNSLVQLASRGIIDEAPFSLQGEARHVGSC